MDWEFILGSVAGAVVFAAAHYVRTGKPPLFDPANKYPFFDMVRDGLRQLLVLVHVKDTFDPGDPDNTPRMAG